jgi:hypothetical protein
MPRESELRKISYTAVILLKTWFARHWDTACPTAAELDVLRRATGLDSELIASWFQNERWRFKSDFCPVHHRPVHASAFEHTADETASSAQFKLSHHNTVLIRPGSRGALRPRTFMTSDGLPLALPDYSIITSDGHILIPASAVPSGATPLGPAVFVATDAFQGRRQTTAGGGVSPVLWDASIARRKGDVSGPHGGRRGARETAAPLRAVSRIEEAPLQLESWNDPSADLGPLTSEAPFAVGATPSWMADACFSPLPPNVQMLAADGSVPHDADFVVLPSDGGTLVIAQVTTLLYVIFETSHSMQTAR